MKRKMEGGGTAMYITLTAERKKIEFFEIQGRDLYDWGLPDHLDLGGAVYTESALLHLIRGNFAEISPESPSREGSQRVRRHRISYFSQSHGIFPVFAETSNSTNFFLFFLFHIFCRVACVD